MSAELFYVFSAPNLLETVGVLKNLNLLVAQSSPRFAIVSIHLWQVIMHQAKEIANIFISFVCTYVKQTLQSSIFISDGRCCKSRCLCMASLLDRLCLWLAFIPLSRQQSLSLVFHHLRMAILSLVNQRTEVICMQLWCLCRCQSYQASLKRL